MNIIISGYGRMGREVENEALKRGHQILLKIDHASGWDNLGNIDIANSVVIDFSQPDMVIDILDHCFSHGIPVVTGTTGWHDQMDNVQNNCHQKNGTLFYAPNFSIGVNVFFRVNQHLAKMMSGINGYSLEIKETHHVHKLDAPSGTAIKAAEGIIAQNQQFRKWVKEKAIHESDLPIISKREGEVTGTHLVTYDSAVDSITLKHQAKNRSGFAIGAVLAAEFVQRKKGVFTMDDLLDKL